MKKILKLQEINSRLSSRFISNFNILKTTHYLSKLYFPKSIFDLNSILAFSKCSLQYMESAMKSSKLNLFAFLLIATFLISYRKSSSADYTISKVNNPAPGLINMNGFSSDVLLMIDNYGTNLAPNQPNKQSSSIKRLKNNTWIGLSNKKYYIYDDFINVIDSIPNPTTLNLDFHDVELLSNGHYLLLLTENKIIDLSNEVEGGQANAKVIFNVLIETDRTGTIYWRWDIADHIEINDVTEDMDLSQNSIDLTHINTVFEDTDGNIVISIRHFDEVAKINKSTGKFIWRLGGSKCKNNQFRFTNDTVNGFIGFSHQHTVQRLPNGNFLMFDNGNLKEPQYSRAVEYSINETQKTITKVWEYRASPDIYQSLMGSVQRLPNGNTLINWTQNKIQEVKPDKSIAFEMNFVNAMVYRATKYVTVMKHVQKEITSSQLYDFSNLDYLSGVQIDVGNKSNNGKVDLQLFDYQPPTANFSDSGFTKIFPYRFVLTSDEISSMNGSIYLNSSKLSKITNPDKATIYHRPKETEGTFQPLNTSYDSFSHEIKGNFPSFGEFVIVSNKLDKPILIRPINYQVAQPNGQLEWEKTKGALKYQIQLDSTKEFKKPIFDITSNSLLFNYSNLKRIDSCYWRVRAINSKDTSQWTDFGRFTTLLPKPKQVSPLRDSLNMPVNLSFNWLAVEGASSYNLMIAEDLNFTKNVIIKNGTGTSLNISNLNNYTKYFWRVQACRSTDSSYWSSTWSFETILPTPALKYPNHQKQNLEVNPILTWETNVASIKYKVEISFNPNFNQLIIDTTIIDKTLPINELMAKTQYYWRVRAVAENRLSNWSDAYTFITGNGFDLTKPTLISPANGSHNDVMGKMNWSKVNYAIKYRLQIFQNDDKINAIIDTIIQKNEFNYKNLKYNNSFTWRVMAMSVYSESKWADNFEFFTIAKSNIIRLNTPLLDELQVPVNCKLEWAEIADINNYELQVADDENFSNLIVNTNSVKINYYYVSNLKLNTKYFWRVRYIENSIESKWSNVWYFTTETKHKLPDAVLLSPSENDTLVNIDCELKWNKVSDASKYQISIALDEDFHQLLYKISNVVDTTYNLANLDYNKRYYWRVSSSSDSAQSQWSKPSNFLTSLKSPQITNLINNQEIVGNELTINWSNSEFDEFYNLQIAKDENFTDGLFNFNNIKDNSLKVSLAVPSKYYLRLKSFGDNNQSFWSNVIVINLKSDVGINDNISNEITIYPNPANDFISIKSIEIGIEYSIYDIKGTLLTSGNTDNFIDISNFPCGVYFIKLNNKIHKFTKG